MLAVPYEFLLWKKLCLILWLFFLLLLSRSLIPVRTQIRIAPSSAPLACRTRRLNGRPLGWDHKNRGTPCHSRCDTQRSFPTQRPCVSSLGLNSTALPWWWWYLHINEICSNLTEDKQTFIVLKQLRTIYQALIRHKTWPIYRK